MGIYSTFATDRKLEAEGRWFSFPANDDNTVPRVRLARMSNTNPAYLKAIEHFQRVFKTELQHDLLTEEVASPVMINTFCVTILLGWEHIQDRDNKEIEFSRENAIKLMTALPDFYLVLRKLASELANYREAEVKTNTGN